MASAGIASRRKSEELILQGRVKVNGKTVSKLGIKINPEKDIVEVDGQKVENFQEKIYIMLNKPKGVVSTVSDPRGRPTVIDLIKGVKQRIYPVGRLDYDTEGLLLLTNDGELTYKITHPKHEIKKTYLAKVKGFVNKEELYTLKKGVNLEDGITAPAQVRFLKYEEGISTLIIKIHEGRNRQIRRMCDSINHPVIYLKRLKIGVLSLKNLKPGNWRKLTKKEIDYLKKITNLK
ncbi:MAG: rRNA synthase [Thermosediminibacterales bacterium]|nr:rRNA synthase [Thermosediminibacterales bacterium]